MPTVGPEGHRERLRKFYLSGEIDSIADHNLLELFLTCVIPRRDVKGLAYDLMNTFGSLEAVCNASPSELMAIAGIGEKTAVAISLISTIYDRIVDNSSRKLTKITSLDDAKKYCRNLLLNETSEKMILVKCSNSGSIINTITIAEGTSNAIDIDLDKLVRYALIGDAASFFIAHNHPNGDSEPSVYDIDFTLKLKNIFGNVHLNFSDHIVVANDGCTAILNDLFPGDKKDDRK